MWRAAALLSFAPIAHGGNALACSYPVREHPILASHPPETIEAGTAAVGLAISEVRIPVRFAKTRYVSQREWLGVRGYRIVDGANRSSSELVEVNGRMDVACFYPGDGYHVSPEGQLVVWITGYQQLGNPMTLFLAPIVQNHDIDGSVWRTVSWSLDDDE